MFICGTFTDSHDEDNPFKGQLLRMDNDGSVQWYKVFEDACWLCRDIGHNMCRGVSYQENTQILAVILELEYYEETGVFDVYVLLFDTAGLFLDAI